MIQLPKIMIVGLMSLVGWVSYGDTGEPLTEQGLTPNIPIEDEGAIVNFLGDIEMDEDWDANNPAKRKDGKYIPGKLEDGVWEWEYVPRNESHIDLTNEEVVEVNL